MTKYMVCLLVLGLSIDPFSETLANDTHITVLTGATVIDGTGADPITDTTIIINGDRIESIGPSASIEIPDNATVIDVTGKWVLPGFIDLHIHLGDPMDDEQTLAQTNSISTLRALHMMDRLLGAGITAVRDLASMTESMAALQAAERLGYISNLRLFPAGNLITTTGGHGDDGYDSYAVGVMAADGPWEFRKAVRQMHKLGFQHIKISPPFTAVEAEAAVDEARIQGMKITSHAGGVSDTEPPSMTRVAVEAGVDSIEHPPKMSKGTLELMAKKGIHWVPTISIYQRIETDYGFPAVLKKRGWDRQLIDDVFKKGKALGLIMGIGTDYIPPFMDEYPRPFFDEMNSFVKLGFTPMETIVSATKNGAIILGKEDELGTIEAGKLADIQVIDGNPLESFGVLGNPEMVMVGGVIHRFDR